MDLSKLKIWRSGLTDEERREQEELAKAENQYNSEKDKVLKAMKHPGFKLIVNKILAETEVKKNQLLRCKPDDLYKLQAEIQVRSEFLHAFQPYVD